MDLADQVTQGTQGQNQEQEIVPPFIQIILDEEAGGDPQINSNLPAPLVIAYLELAKQKCFAQFYGAVQQIRAQAALKKPDLTIARVVPPNLR